MPLPGLKGRVIPISEMVLGSLRRVAWAAFLATVLDRALKAILGYERGRHNLRWMCTNIYSTEEIPHSHYSMELAWSWVFVLIVTAKIMSFQQSTK